MFCSNCGATICNGHSKYCSECGMPLVEEKKSVKYRAMKCPNCSASVSYADNIEKVTCTFCGVDFLVDDKATEISRRLRAESEAKKRDMQTQIEYEENQTKLELEKEKVRFLTTNGLKIVLLIICVIYMLYKLIRGELVGLDLIMILIVFKVFIMPHKKSKK